MRSSVLTAAFLLASTLACSGVAGGPAHAPFEGEWRVVNEKGKETGQIIDFQAEEITLTTLGRADTQPATYTADGDHVTVSYMAWDYALKMGADDKHASFKGKDGGGVQYELVRD